MTFRITLKRGREPVKPVAIPNVIGEYVRICSHATVGTGAVIPFYYSFVIHG